MKGFLFLFSFYLLSLMVMPCPDGSDATGTVQPVITAALQDHNHNHDHAKACPPFCVCSCCYTITTVMPADGFIYEKPVLLSGHTVDFYTDEQLDNFKDHIWQPPRLS